LDYALARKLLNGACQGILNGKLAS
jgi:hypothetical protein